jgi:MFS family permease
MAEIPEQTASRPKTEKPPLWTLNFILICASTLCIFLAFHSLYPTLPIYIERFGGSTRIAGLALTSLTVAAIFSRPITGWALDKYGRKAIFIGGLVIFLIPMVVYIWLVPVVLLIALRFVQGLGWGIGNTASGTVASDIVPRQRMGEGMGYYSLTLSISMAFSPVLALWLIDHYSFRELFMACALLTLTSLLLALLIRYPKTERPRSVPAPSFVFMEKAALQPAAVILFVIFTYSSVISFLPLYARQQGLATVGYFFTAMALTTLISRPLSGIIVDRAGRRGYDISVIISTIATVAAMPVLAQTTSLSHLLWGGFLYGIGFGFIQPTMLALAIRSVPAHKKGAANATFWTAVDMGAASGSLCWGFVAAAFGYQILFNLTIIPLLIALTIYFTWRNPTDITVIAD